MLEHVYDPDGALYLHLDIFNAVLVTIIPFVNSRQFIVRCHHRRRASDGSTFNKKNSLEFVYFTKWFPSVSTIISNR